MSDEPIAPYPYFHGDNKQHLLGKLPTPPPWRRFTPQAKVVQGRTFRVSDEAREMVNAALLLRRPLLVTGKPGTGKTSLAYAVAEELGLGDTLVWPITTRSTLQEGLYSYDAIARLQDAALAEKRAGTQPNSGPSLENAQDETKNSSRTDDSNIGRYIRLGPLGTAMLPNDSERPRVLLIDEIDKSDIDLPNDLLHIFEEGRFDIPELARLPDEETYREMRVLTADRRKAASDPETTAVVKRGRVTCTDFPFVLLTSNGEREFPPAFLRRCLRLQINPPTEGELREIVRMRLFPPQDDLTPQEDSLPPEITSLITNFFKKREELKVENRYLSTDQLLNAAYILMKGITLQDQETLHDALFQPL